MGGLIIKEAAHFHSEGMGAAAFRHGPFEMLRPDIFVLVYAGEQPALARSLVRDVRAVGARAALVGPSAELAAFRLPDVPAVARPILEMLPPQMLSVTLAGMAGREPGRFELITKITTVE
jgi:glucosamine--fructose-6-phosphate aminotransferase (isomerizing)